MREQVIKLGRLNVTLIITMASVFSSVIMYIVIANIMNERVVPSGVITSFVVPSLIAPLVSLYLTKMLFQVHHLEVEMRALATYDSLTKLMSRQAFLTNAKTLYQLVKREKSQLTMVYIDIDNFKLVNDLYGHLVGDKVLQSFGRVLNNHKRESDLVGRIGGEEFALLLNDTNTEGSKNFITSLQEVIRDTIVIHGDVKISFTASIGLAVYTQENCVDFNELIKRADESLYIAKNSGKNCFKVYQDGLIYTT